MAQVIIRSYKNNFKKMDEVALADNIFLTAYASWNDAEVGNDIIKVMLPANEEKALQLCNTGIVIDNIKYIAYTATPSMQKKEEEEHGEKCEMFFLKEDKREFIPYFEDLISLGTIKQFDNKEICINKKVTSRIALAMSSTTKLDFVPRIAVVPNKEYELFEDVIWYTSENGKLVEHKEDNKAIKTTLHDGFGLMNQTCADAIKSSLNLNYGIDFAVIRLYGLAVKGLCLRFDWVDYIENYCDNKHFVKDVWGNDVDLRNVDMILTESQCKWWGNFKDDEFYTKINECEDDLIKCLYVTKVNKKKTKEYSLANYQLISNLSLGLKDLIELSKDTVKLYKGVIDGDLASIKYFLKEFENEDGEYCPQQKVDYLLNANNDFIKSAVVKETLHKAILKSVALLSSGKFYVKGRYSLMIPNPFLLVDNLLGIDRTTLNKNEFYIPHNNNKQFTISRNPLASPWEIKNIETVDNELFNKYFSKYTDEIVFFNNIDYTHCQLSSADYDGDGVLCVENAIIYNNVISDDRKFFHVSEGETKEMEYNTENKFKALIKSSGNLIGSLAINGAKISNTCLYGTKKDIVNAFYSNRDKLLYLTELEMQVIDAPKTLKLPSKAELTVLDITQPKPLFLRYKDGYYKAHKTNEDDLSHYEQFAKLIIDELLMPCVENVKNGSDMLANYIYSQNVAVDNNCLIDIENLKNAIAVENKKLKMNEKRYKENYKENYKEAYTLMVTKYQLLSNKIRSKYNHRQICNCLTKIPRLTDKFIINYFWYELVVKLNELDLTTKVLNRCEDGEYEFFGHNYKLVETKLIEDNLQEKEIEKKMKRKGKKGIISIGKCDFEQLKGDCKVIIDTASIDLLKDNQKITYAFKDIKDINNKSTKDNLYECSTIDIVDIYKETDKTYKVLINY